MSVRILYNNDIAFRRRASFYRMYRGRDFKKRFRFELIATLAALVIACALFPMRSMDWFTASAIPSYAFWATAAIFLIGLFRLLRSLVAVWRVKSAPERGEREYVFDERGFTFGATDGASERIATSWVEIDRAYITTGAIYILCMSRRHWAAVDLSLIKEGTGRELAELLIKYLPKFKIVGGL